MDNAAASVKQKVFELCLDELSPVVTKLVGTIESKNMPAYLGLCVALEVVAQRVLAGGIDAQVKAGDRAGEFAALREAVQHDATQALQEFHPWLALVGSTSQPLLGPDGQALAPTNMRRPS